ncbi:M24 family metallopeptidase [Cohnella cholangitidis]|uniref:M24 family metallopeptidase n=1 Tax=Cohnella cholangitidis TaxID=2598458 RepID=A0A7G5C0A2_9BACL|nr:M24 family metallopeptidase [Cohnella cholangitidis]QMV42636.1 M24 family metallopeptidase [Cohnella cholangitidis]
MRDGILARKLSALRNVMNKQGWEAVILTQQKNVSWLTRMRSHINMAVESACCIIVVTVDQCSLLSSNMESERLLSEELRSEEYRSSLERFQWPWYEPARRDDLIRDLTPGCSALVTDTSAEVEGELVLLRTKVLDSEHGEWRLLGRMAAEAIESCAKTIARGQSEQEIAGLLARHCWDREIEPIVALVAVDERILSVRHPLPTGKRVEAYAMLVLCARKYGKIVSVTRLVHFGRPPDEIVRKHAAVAEIDARMMDATRPGRSLDEMFVMLQLFYRDAGYADEIYKHHQGGFAGYATREQLALPGVSRRIEANGVYAWNPSITGVKSEDTLLLRDKGAEIITASGEYPTIVCKIGGGSWKRPDILVRSTGR